MTETELEIDELKRAWQALDRRLDRQRALELAAFKHARLGDVRGALRPLAIGRIAQIVGGALLVLLIAPFWVAHRTNPLLLALGLFGHAYGVALIVLAALDLRAISQIDWAAPVLALQKRLAEVRARRLRAATFHAVANCFLWIPVTFALVDRVGAGKVLERPGLAAWAIAWGFVPLAFLLAFFRWMRSPKRAAFAQQLDDQTAGRSVSRAQALLDEVARFEAE